MQIQCRASNRPEAQLSLDYGCETESNKRIPLIPVERGNGLGIVHIQKLQENFRYKITVDCRQNSVFQLVENAQVMIAMRPILWYNQVKEQASPNSKGEKKTYGGPYIEMNAMRNTYAFKAT